MGRYHSVYQSQKPPSRWPWLLAGALIAIVAIAIGAFLGSGGDPDRLLVAAHLKGAATTPTRGAIVALNTPTVVIPATDTATAETAPTVGPTDVPAVEPTAAPSSTSAGEAAVTPSVEPTATTEATPPPPAVDGSSPDAVLAAWGERWAAGDYAGLYQLLTSTAKASISEQDFTDRYSGIAWEIGQSAVVMTVTSPPDLNTQATVHVSIQTSKVGPIEQDNVVQLRQEGDGWKVDWTPSLILADLGDGCVDFTADVMRRGSILDRNGENLAYDGYINVIGIIPGQFVNEAIEVKALAKLIGVSETDIKKAYEDGEANWFMPVKRYPQKMDEKIVSGIAALPGVAIRTETARIYPLGKKAAHITGYATKVTAEDIASDPTGSLTADDWLGRAGIEAGANELLAGRSGGRLAIVECGSRAERKLIAERKAVPSQDIILTIDKTFQVTVDDALGDVQGSVVVLDPRNGAVLALASHPSYDPNLFVTGISNSDWAYLSDETKRPMVDRASEAGYPTGSIFKVITMAAGMKHLGLTGESEFDCPQSWSIPGSDQIWRDWTYEEGLGAQGWMNLHWALVNSCNTIFYELGYELDQKDDTLLPNMAKSFGLGTATGIPYFPEIAGNVPDPAWKQDVVGDYWATGDAVNLSIGQGYLEATPLQMAVAYAAIANGGSVLQPFLVEYTQAQDGTLTRVGKRVERSKLPLKKAQIDEIQSALRDQTSNTWGAGSSRIFADMAWPIAGKTGTAQNQLTREGKPHSWFAAFGPYGEEATIASIAMVESVGEGVSFAAPITRTIYDAYIQTDLAATTNAGIPPPIKPADDDSGG